VLFGFCGDNTNFKLGCVLGRGEIDLITKLTDRIERDIGGIGCVAHIVHSCVQSTYDMFSIEVYYCTAVKKLILSADFCCSMATLVSVVTSGDSTIVRAF
jgi:hypothetical protein